MDARQDRPSQGKDLQDFRHSSAHPEVAFAHKQMLPDAARAGDAPPDPPAARRLKMFLPGNIWQWVVDYARYRLGPRRDFLTYTDPAHDNGVYPLVGESDGKVRVALAGDWGTGTDEAIKVAARMTDFHPHYTIHLGDVYFVGDPDEVNENFLGIADPTQHYKPSPWPLGSRGSFALNGNHEMYARGVGYFDLILPALGLREAGRKHQQGASFFCLENAHWRIVGLDTGYNSVGIPVIENLFPPDCALPEKLMAWLRDEVFHTDDQRGIVILSHHQYYSRFDPWYTKAAEQLASFIARPVLWFWGHEHRLAVYEKFQTGNAIAAYGRCIGHGGMPVDLPGEVLHEECSTVFVDERRYANEEGLDVGMNGFVQLTFAGPELQVEYVDLAGTKIFAETWRVDADGAPALVAQTRGDDA